MLCPIPSQKSACARAVLNQRYSQQSPQPEVSYKTVLDIRMISIRRTVRYSDGNNRTYSVDYYRGDTHPDI